MDEIKKENIEEKIEDNADQISTPGGDTTPESPEKETDELAQLKEKLAQAEETAKKNYDNY
ncbi:MAG: hypothetical protein GX790_02240, partial [Syntrophomonadaceae bacterium]|nr:hypothetical protein [Syntrophomonadaceae bacterium]